ncbi:hypothetical protein V1517DRAFT_170889 [Lipomyces orientalis]|uniref:Uncharacterized protein n=1 Tax=Lipomyces orientalis TaxID=1233043 RepID=A0ACC3TK02_9ASCO
MAVEKKLRLPTDPHELPQFVMQRLHFVFEAAFYSILKHLEQPPQTDLCNFLGYCEAWCTSLLAHHDTEEHIMFPYLQRKLDFAEEVEQHKKIHDALDAFVEQIRLAKKDSAAFDPARMMQILKDAEDNLMAHLHQEIDDLAPDRLKVFSGEELDEMMKLSEKYAQKHTSPVVMLPLLRSHTPPEHRCFPPLPWPVEKLLLPFLAMRHGGYWKYSPYSVV